VGTSGLKTRWNETEHLHSSLPVHVLNQMKAQRGKKTRFFLVKKVFYIIIKQQEFQEMVLSLEISEFS